MNLAAAPVAGGTYCGEVVDANAIDRSLTIWNLARSLNYIRYRSQQACLLGKPDILRKLLNNWVEVIVLLRSLFETVETREAAEVGANQCRDAIHSYLDSGHLGDALRTAHENVELSIREDEAQHVVAREIAGVIDGCLQPFITFVDKILHYLEESEKRLFFLAQFVDGLQHPVDSFGHLFVEPPPPTDPNFRFLPSKDAAEISPSVASPGSGDRTIDDDRCLHDLPNTESNAFSGKPSREWVARLRSRFTECDIHESWFPWESDIVPLHKLANEVVAEVEASVTGAVRSGHASTNRLPYLGVEISGKECTRRTVPDVIVTLDPQEIKLLRFFLQSQQKKTSKKWFCEHWSEFGRSNLELDSNTVDAAINRLSGALMDLKLTVPGHDDGWYLTEL